MPVTITEHHCPLSTLSCAAAGSSPKAVMLGYMSARMVSGKAVSPQSESQAFSADADETTRLKSLKWDTKRGTGKRTKTAPNIDISTKYCVLSSTSSTDNQILNVDSASSLKRAEILIIKKYRQYVNHRVLSRSNENYNHQNNLYNKVSSVRQ